jgi:hypothetical protein
MSNSLAIAAVTMTLQHILQRTFDLDGLIHDTTVTTLPLDKARPANVHNNQLNLFLYMMARNAAWVNADMPRQVKPGEIAIAPLPLNLYFLLTAFGRNDDDVQAFGHEVMGKAMIALYDHAILSAQDIRDATKALLPDNDLDKQIERIRITFHPLSIDELSKLWTGFSMQYRLSAAYEVGVALLESTRSPLTPLPVLTRGAKDEGFAAQGDLTPPLPTLFSATPPNTQPAVRLGELLTLAGVHLDGSNVGVRFNHRLWNTPIEQAPEPGATSTSLGVKIPTDAKAWPAGFYTVEVLVQRTGETFRRTTNQLTVALAPSIVTIVPTPIPAGKISYTVTVLPEVRPEQRATLMIADAELLPKPPPPVAPSGTLVFVPVTLVAGRYLARLRVDGVDSLAVDRSTSPPAFDATQQVNVT